MNTIWCEAGLIHCTSMWWNHMTYLGEAQQNVWCCLQQLWSHLHDPVSRWSSSMMVPHPSPHPAASTQSQHGDDCHQTGVVFVSHVTLVLEEASPPVSSKLLLAEISRCFLLWGVELKRKKEREEGGGQSGNRSHAYSTWMISSLVPKLSTMELTIQCHAVPMYMDLLLQISWRTVVRHM